MPVQSSIQSVWRMACGVALPVAAASVSLASSQATGVAGVAFAMSAGLFAGAGAIWANLYAGRRQQQETEEEAELARLFNHDLAKAAAKSMATLLGPLADEKSLSDAERGAIEALIDRAEEAWLRVAEAEEPAFAPILEGQLAEAVMIDPEDPKFGPYGDEAMWREVVRRIAAEVDAIEGADGGADSSIIAHFAEGGELLRQAARVCREGFARQFFNDLKHDFATKGQAFAAVHLRMMGEIVTLARASAKKDARVRAELDNLTIRVNELVEEVLRANESRGNELRAFEGWLRPMLSEIKNEVRRSTDTVVAKLELIPTEVADAVLRMLEERRILPSSQLLMDGTVIQSQSPEFTKEEMAFARQALASRDGVVRASAWIVEGKYDKARDELAGAAPGVDAAIEQAARHFTTLGDSFYFEGRFDAAVPHYQRVLDILGSTPTPQAILNLANSLERSQDNMRCGLERAISLYSQVLERDNISEEVRARAIFSRGEAYRRSGQFDMATADFVELLSTGWMRIKWVEKALTNLGVMAGEKGRLIDAILKFTSVLTLLGVSRDGASLALYNRGIAYRKIGRFNESYLDYARAINLADADAPLKAMALVQRGVGDWERNKSQDAINCFSRAIEISDVPTEVLARAFCNRGIAFYELGATVQGMADLSRAIGLPGASVDAIAAALCARGRIHMDGGRLHEAFEDLSFVISQPGIDECFLVDALCSRGYIHKKLDRLDHAIDDYSRAINCVGASQSHLITALLERGAIYGSLHQLPKAIADFAQIIDWPGSHVEEIARAMFLRGLALSMQQKDTDACRDFIEAARLFETVGNTAGVEQAIQARNDLACQ
jgi:tetratricopeptide (TPR) repeat protein